MSVVRWRRSNTHCLSTYIGPSGEIIVNTDNWHLYLQDGVTLGGIEIANLSDADTAHLQILDEGTVLTNTVSSIDFVGTGLTATTIGNAVTVSHSHGNLAFTGQGIFGTITNANIGFAPLGTGAVIYSLNNQENVPAYLRIDSPHKDTTQIATVLTDSLVLSAPYTSINLQAGTGHIGFNGDPSPGFKYAFFDGAVYSREFYADANFPAGYQFTTPLGTTGLSHAYESNVSLLQLRHDDRPTARFYENLTTILSGNLVVSDNGIDFGSFPDAFVQVYSNVDSYSQFVHQNLNNTNTASTDFVATAGNGNDSTYYVDMGIASNSYSYPGYGVIKPNDAYLYAVGNSTTGPGASDSGNLIIGTTTGNIVMFVGAPEDNNVIVKINTTTVAPGANVTYSLGSQEYQWKDLHLGNVMYLNGFPVTIGTDGTLAINNSSVISGITITNTAPIVTDGGLWWNADDGRAYVKYNNQWVDLSPTVYTASGSQGFGNIVPAANITYNLGSVDRQWKDLWVSNNTIYIGGAALGVTTNGNLTVNGTAVTGDTISKSTLQAITAASTSFADFQTRIAQL